MSEVTPIEWGVHLLRPVTGEEATLIRRTGASRVTVHAPWRWLEPRPGAWTTAALDHLLEPLRREGLPVQAILGPGMPHLLPDGQHADQHDYPERFAAFCAEAATRLPDVDVFRVEDELNAAFIWESLRTRRRRGRRWRDRSFRLRLLVGAVDAVRAARPDAEVRLTVQTSIPGWSRAVRRWLKAGIRPDRLGLSLLLPGVLPDTDQATRVGEVVVAARRLLDRSGASDVGVEIARVGYPTVRETFTPRRQREFLLAAGRAAGSSGALALHWWALRDQAHDDPVLGYWAPAGERHAGLLFFDSTPKPALEELRVLATGQRL